MLIFIIGAMWRKDIHEADPAFVVNIFRRSVMGIVQHSVSCIRNVWVVAL